jgi:hypothetical protein
MRAEAKGKLQRTGICHEESQGSYKTTLQPKMKCCVKLVGGGSFAT